MTSKPNDAPTRRGVHDLLAADDRHEVVSADGAGAPGYRSGRTLSLRVETGRQIRRRRTQVIGLVLLVLPVIIGLAFKAGGGSGNGGSALVNLATTGAANFAMFTEFASVGFLLVVMVALFCGDTVSSEASWSSLRYLLALPVPRSRLLRQKLTVALGFTVVINVLLPAWSYLVGGVFFGWAPARSPVSGEFTNLVALERLGIVVVYATIQALLVAAVAFWLSVLTDAPLGAVGGATFVIIVSNILDSITALDPYRQLLPTHFQFSWLDALGPDIVWDDMIRGTGVVLIYASVFLLMAWTHFLRKDITS
ncbi:MAG: family transporter protein [Pseudonocardiales bacterium]|nr:family transporter protein [Pseudonocardiales bacterium]